MKNPLNYSLKDYATSDAKMQQCLELAEVATKTDLPVLILGESGTGKTLIANAIHKSSKRKNSPFISFNAAALSDTLLDSQLFGHEKGAFTNAEKRVKGKFEQADSGTLFLDEIADMSTSAQAKILRVIEYGEFERLGSEEIQKADVRLISATHLPLEEFVEANKFRKDLFYRVSGLTIRIPSLKERPNDLKILIGQQISIAAMKEEKIIKGLNKAALDCLLSYNWPGNLRELSRVTHTAVVICKGDVIKEKDIFLDKKETNIISPELNGTEVIDAVEHLSLEVAEIKHILNVLNLMDGNKRKTAKALNISRSTLDRKLASQ